MRTAAKKKNQGVTRVEIAVILATLALLATVTRPVWASGSATKSLACMDNLRRLSAAWLLYADDNGGKFVGNYHGGFVPTLTGKERPWVTGWLDWGNGPDITNTVYLTNPRYASLAPYFGASTTVYKCPADDYLSRTQAARGWWGRVRSYSMSCALGEGNLYAGPFNNAMLQVVRNSGFTRLSPQQTFVFLDEHPDSLNDGLFWIPNSAVTMPDVPGAFHDGAAWFTFADGHLEQHGWQSSSLLQPVTAANYLNSISISAGNPDVQWLLDHTPMR